MSVRGKRGREENSHPPQDQDISVQGETGSWMLGICPPLPHTSCESLGTLLSFSVPQFPHLYLGITVVPTSQGCGENSVSETAAELLGQCRQRGRTIYILDE